MANIQIGYTNVLASATLTATSSATNYSANRLKDSDFGKLWICGSATAPQRVVINQSLSPIACNCLVIHKHTLNGLTLSLEYSSGGSSYSTETSWTQSGNGLIKKTFNSTTNNYWRISHTAGTGPMRMAEIFLTSLVSFSAQPRVNLNESKTYLVKSLESRTGVSTFMSFTTSKRKYDYSVLVGSSDKTYWENVQTYYDTYGPFFFIDHEGNEIIAELASDIYFSSVTLDKYELLVSIQEVII